MTTKRILALMAVIGCACAWPGRGAVAEQAKHEVSLADGKLRLSVPDTWVRKEPKVRIVEYEFAVPASKGDDTDGRVTVMGAGGSIEDNIDRWTSQFSQPDGSRTKQRATVKKTKVAGEEVHLVDVSGTFKDQRGPMAPAVERDGYRLLGAIIVSSHGGNYFVKFTGPRRTVTDNERAFLTMIEGLDHR